MASLRSEIFHLNPLAHSIPPSFLLAAGSASQTLGQLTLFFLPFAPLGSCPLPTKTSNNVQHSLCNQQSNCSFNHDPSSTAPDSYPTRTPMSHSTIISFFTVICLTLLIGCCPKASIAGSVMSTDGKPINHAYVSILGKTTYTNKFGCFNINQAIALPDRFIVEAEGYQNIVSPAEHGYYQVQVVLASKDSNDINQVEWIPISAKSFRSIIPCE